MTMLQKNYILFDRQDNIKNSDINCENNLISHALLEDKEIGLFVTIIVFNKSSKPSSSDRLYLQRQL